MALMLDPYKRIMTRHGEVLYSFVFTSPYTDIADYHYSQHISIGLYINNGELLFGKSGINNPSDIDVTCKSMLKQLENYIDDRNGICMNGIFHCTDNMSLDKFMELCKKSIKNERK